MKLKTIRALFLCGIITIGVSCFKSDSDLDIEGVRVVLGEKTAVDISGDGIYSEKNGFITMGASASGEIIIVGAYRSNLYYTDDGGISWYTLEGLGENEYWSGASVSDNGKFLSVAGENLYTTSNSGETWTIHPFVDDYDGDTKLCMSNDGKTIASIHTHTISEINISNNFGKTWIARTLNGNNIEAIGMSSDGLKIAALYYYRPLWLTNDFGENWKETDSGCEQWAAMDISSDGKYIVLADFGAIKYYPENKSAIHISKDSGKTWECKEIDGIQCLYDVAISNDGKKIIVGSNRVMDPFMISFNSGESWEAISKPDFVNQDWPSFNSVFSASGTRIVAMEKGYSIWTSDDYGVTWVERIRGEGGQI